MLPSPPPEDVAHWCVRPGERQSKVQQVAECPNLRGCAKRLVWELAMPSSAHRTLHVIVSSRRIHRTVWESGMLHDEASNNWAQDSRRAWAAFIAKGFGFRHLRRARVPQALPWRIDSSLLEYPASLWRGAPSEPESSSVRQGYKGLKAPVPSDPRAAPLQQVHGWCPTGFITKPPHHLLNGRTFLQRQLSAADFAARAERCFETRLHLSLDWKPSSWGNRLEMTSTIKHPSAQMSTSAAVFSSGLLRWSNTVWHVRREILTVRATEQLNIESNPVRSCFRNLISLQ